MSRRNFRDMTRRSKGSALRSLFSLVLALSAGRPIFRASGHITLSGTGDVLSVHDDNDDAHVLTQADTARQCDPPAAHADFANQLCLTFTGVEWYDSSRAAAYWQPWHDGSGSGIAVAATSTSASTRYLCSTGVVGTGPGVSIAHDASTWFQLVATNASYIVNQTVGARNGSPKQYRADYLEGGSPEARLKVTGAAQVTANSTSAPSASAPARTMRLGARNEGNNPFIGRVHCLLTSPGAVPDLYQQWITQETGIAA